VELEAWEWSALEVFLRVEGARSDLKRFKKLFVRLPCDRGSVGISWSQLYAYGEPMSIKVGNLPGCRYNECYIYVHVEAVLSHARGIDSCRGRRQI
jgi:hypothetical protein